MGIAPTGKQLTMPRVSTLRVYDGKVTGAQLTKCQ